MVLVVVASIGARLLPMSVLSTSRRANLRRPRSNNPLWRRGTGCAYNPARRQLSPTGLVRTPYMRRIFRLFAPAAQPAQQQPSWTLTDEQHQQVLQLLSDIGLGIIA